MRLKNAPWKLEETEEFLTVTDKSNLDVTAFDLSDDCAYLPGSLEEERLKAKAIALLPELLEILGEVEAANQAEDDEKYSDGMFRLLNLYDSLKVGS